MSTVFRTNPLPPTMSEKIYTYLIHWRGGNTEGRRIVELNKEIDVDYISRYEKEKQKEVGNGYVAFVASVSLLSVREVGNIRESSVFVVLNKTLGSSIEFDIRQEALDYFDACVEVNKDVYEYELSVRLKWHKPPEVL